MCLYTDKNKPEIAKTDIKVFKCFRSIRERYSSKPYRELRTLYIDEPVTHEEAVGRVPLSGKSRQEPDLHNGKYRVGPGYIHAFLTMDAAKAAVRGYFVGKDWYHPVIVEAVIPKGTPYFKGVGPHDIESIAAENMVIGKQLECYVDYKFYECDAYYASLDKANMAKSQREIQPFD